MSPSLCILGRQPALGLAELESLYGPTVVQPVGTQAALLNVETAQVDFSRLGGTMKFAKVLTMLQTTSWSDIQAFLEKSVPEHAARLPKGKLRLGLSIYGLTPRPAQIMATGLTLKKALRASGRPVRFIPNTEIALNSAQVLHNQLTSTLGWELLFIKDGARTICAQTIAVQDITAYTLRDRRRPKRDARVGMLPPKLAQIIINLAAGKAQLIDPSCGPRQSKNKTILDPFCGTGVILQEAVLMGYNVCGSDLEPRMTDYAIQNLEWLERTFQLAKFKIKLEVGDATNHHWQQPFDMVASETYLGLAFTMTPNPKTLESTRQTCDRIISRFLSNIHGQITNGTRLCLAVPAWHSASGFHRLPCLDHLEELGYTSLSFVHAKDDQLIYHREGQIVARELVVIVRK